jgi:hypothetical protein
MKAGRTINPISIKQGHCRHLVLGAGFRKFLWNRSAFKEAKSRAGMKFDIHREAQS